MITVYYRKVFPLQKEDTFSRISPCGGMGAADIPLTEKLDEGRRQKLLRLKNEKPGQESLRQAFFFTTLCAAGLGFLRRIRRPLP